MEIRRGRPEDLEAAARLERPTRADSIDLANASTFPELRGGGVGRALTAHVIAWAHEAGCPVMVTD